MRVALLLLCCLPILVEAQEGRIATLPETVIVDGKAICSLRVSDKFKKPFLHPVYAPDGTEITRPLSDEFIKEHPHHKGIWVSVDTPGDIRFWNEDGPIKNIETRVLESDPPQVVMTNLWTSSDGKAILKERTQIKTYADHMLIYEITFEPAGDSVTFGDTKEGLLGFRMASSMREDKTGKTVNDEGVTGTKALWGTTSKWMDYSGTIDGKTVGLALLDSPTNFRPSRYHIRHYGLFSINPFGQKAYTKGKLPAAPVTLKKGESLTLRYGVFVHMGDAEAGKVAEAYDRFLKRLPKAETKTDGERD